MYQAPMSYVQEVRELKRVQRCSLAFAVGVAAGEIADTLLSTDVYTMSTKLGFAEKRQKGSHKIFENIRGDVFIVAAHGNKELRSGVTHELRKISGLTDEEFIKLLKK